MKRRVCFMGGDADGRNNESKLRSFHSALENSYQAEWITLHKDEKGERRARCLINPSRLTEQFDKKVISIDFDYGMKEGDVFYWDRTENYWIVNLQQHTEEAYFRGIIRRCEYQVEVDGEWYWVSLTGPDEESLEWRNKHKIYFNDLNYSMSLQIAKNNKTVEYFSRFKIIKMRMTYPDKDTGEELYEYHNWQVVATDKYSSTNILEVYLREHYDNEEEEQMIIHEPIEYNEKEPYIDGPQFVNVYDTDLKYEIKNISGGNWAVDNSTKVKISNMTDTSCVVDILAGKSMSFNLIYKVDDGTKVELPIKVKSL